MVTASRTALSALSLLSFALGQGIDSMFDTGNAEPASTRFAPGRFIIEYDSSSSGLSKRDLATSVLNSLSSAGLEISVNSNMDSSIFTGASITVINDNTTTVADLKAHSNVKNVWPVSYVTLDDGDMTDADASQWNPHVMTGVDALHKRNITGKGMTIAIVDTGVDYTHAAFGNCLGESCKIVGGWNFMDDIDNPTQDDLTDCVGHGTFVSSLIVGEADDMVGVAPDAQIRFYKVFGCEDSTTNDYILAGMLKAYEEKPDVMSLSLGANIGYDTDPLAELAARIAKDLVVVFAAGNSGTTGTFYAANGGSGEGVIAVAAAHASQVGGWKARAISSLKNETYTFGYVSNQGDPFTLDPGTYKADFTTDNACLTSKQSNGNTILFAKMGYCYVGNMFNSLQDLGYNTALIYLDSQDTYINYFDTESIFTEEFSNFGQVTYEFGQWLTNQTSLGAEITIEILEDAAAVGFPNDFSGAGQMDYYSSWGPTFFNSFYPHAAAPGGVVFGATANTGDEWAISSGTSFACPYVAGVAALFLAENPDAAPGDYRKCLMTTAKDMDLYIMNQDSYGTDSSTLLNDTSAPLVQQGAGMINALSIIDQKTRVTSDAFLELNSSDFRVSDFTISIVNDNDESVTYDISHVPGTSIESRTSVQWVPNGYYPPYGSLAAQVTLSQSSLTLGPGESGSIDVNIQSPSGASLDTGTIFGGKIHFVGGNGDAVKVPYMGVEVDSYEWTTWMDDPLVVEFGSDGYVYNLTQQDRIREYDPSSNDSPVIYYNLRYGCKMYSYDIVDADYDLSSYSYPPVAGQNGYLGPIRSQPTLGGTYITFPIAYPARFTNINFFGFDGFTNGSVIPEGKYRLLSRSVRLFGEYENDEDWQLYLSDPFIVGPAEGEVVSSTVVNNATTVGNGVTATDIEQTTGTITTSSAPIVSFASQFSDEFSSVELTSIDYSSSYTSSGSEASSSSPTKSSSSSSSAVSSCVAETLSGNVELITDYVVQGFYTNSETVYNKGDMYWVYITFKSEQLIAVGSKSWIFMEGLTGYYFAANYVMDGSGNFVAMVAADFQETGTNLTFTWMDRTSVQTTEGTFSFTMRMTDDSQALVTGPGDFEMKAQTAQKEYSSTLVFAPEPEDSPYRNTFYDAVNKRVHWIVDIPGSIGSWSSLKLSSTVSSFYYSYDCSSTTVQIGSDLDEWRNATTFTDANLSTETCAIRSNNFVYNQPIAEDEVLRIHMQGVQESFIMIYANNMEIEIDMDGTTTQSYTLTDVARSAQTFNNYVMNLYDYTPNCDTTYSSVTLPETSTSMSSAPASSTGVSSAPASSAGASSAPGSSFPVVDASSIDSSVSSTTESSSLGLSSPVSDSSSLTVSSEPASSTPTSSAPASATPEFSAPGSSAPGPSSPVSTSSSPAVSSDRSSSSTPVSSEPSSVPAASESLSSAKSAVTVAYSSSASLSGDSSLVPSTGSSSVGISSDASSASASTNSVTPSSSSTEEPTVSGSYSGSDLNWVFTIPGSLGPWTTVVATVTKGLGNIGFDFTSADIFVHGVDVSNMAEIVATKESISVTIDFPVGPNDPLVIDVGGLISGGFAWSMNAHIEITTADGKKLMKRAVTSFDLSDTITSDASSASSIVSSTTVLSSSTVDQSSASSVTVSSADVASPSTSAPSIVASSAASSLKASSEVSSTGSVTSSGVSSDYLSSVPSEMTSGVSSLSAVGSSIISSNSESYNTSVGSSTTSASSIVFSPGVPDVSGVSLSPSTFKDDTVSTTVVTITSCSNNACSETTVTTGLTVATTTISGLVSEYTTYCPLTTQSSTVADAPGTTVITVTSCSEGKCSATGVTTGFTVVTTTSAGVATVYTTYCLLTDSTDSSTSAAGVATSAGITGGETFAESSDKTTAQNTATAIKTGSASGTSKTSSRETHAAQDSTSTVVVTKTSTACADGECITLLVVSSVPAEGAITLESSSSSSSRDTSTSTILSEFEGMASIKTLSFTLLSLIMTLLF